MANFFQKFNEEKAYLKEKYTKRVDALPSLLNHLPQKTISFVFYMEAIQYPDEVPRNDPFDIVFTTNVKPSEIVGAIDQHCHAAEDRSAFRYALCNTLEKMQNIETANTVNCYIYREIQKIGNHIFPYY